MAKTPDNILRLEKAIEELENAIIGADPEAGEYAKMVSSLETLYKLKNGKNPSSLELKDWMPIIGSLSSILILCVFEAYGHTIVSKGLGFIVKPKG